MRLGGATAITATAAVVLLLSVGSSGRGQQSPAPAPTLTHVVPDSAATQEDQRTVKQKQLDDQAQRLVTMAGELKAAVDKTNKNILSLDVVRKAEEIEVLAHKMKDQGRK